MINKKAQITIFIILGLVILFTFIFTTQLVKKIKIDGLNLEKTSVLSSNFKKDSFQLYVENCLRGQLEKGLELIGKQGRIWKGQPGGSLDFVDGWNGVRLPDVNVSYGLVFGEKGYIPDNKYPCEEGDEPAFCKYQYPNSSILPAHLIKFGGLKTNEAGIKKDLEAFLMNRTIQCVKEFIRDSVSSSALVSTENLEVNIDLLDEGITVGVDYPLKLSLAGEEFFHQTKFDFFYPSEFKKLWDAAVSYPSKMDWSFSDFNYSEENLKAVDFTAGKGTPKEKTLKNPFSSQYNQLGAEFKNYSLANGDDLFSFKVEPGSVLRDKGYLLQVARQNRPPALDYVERYSCEKDGYDYLVVLGDENLKAIDINLFAKDPNEDAVHYNFEANAPLGNSAQEENHFHFEPDHSGSYTLTAYASDEHGLKDWQKVRVLVDRVAQTGISLELPYDVNYKLGENYVVSNEDPVFVKARWPDESLTSSRPSTVALKYNNVNENFDFPLPDPNIRTQTCFNLPWKAGVSSNCNIEDYSGDQLKNWKTTPSEGGFDINPFHSLTSAPGKLTLDFTMNYCDNVEQTSSSEIKLYVKSCVPHKDPTRPFAFPYEKYEFGLKSDGTTDFNNLISDSSEINPFYATHSCCQGNPGNPNTWEIKSGDICFESPTPDCEGKIPDYTASLGPTYQGYILVQKIDRCDGLRGNICGNGISSNEAQLWKGELRCGDTKYSGCNNNINPLCAGNFSWGFIDKNKNNGVGGWCHGTMGCQSLCPSEVVDKFSISRSNNRQNLNLLALNNKAIFDDESLGFVCGCEGNLGKPCDKNFDGFFRGTCRIPTQTQAGGIPVCEGDN